MKREDNHRWDVGGDLRGLGKRRSAKRVDEDVVELSEIKEEHFAPDWHWGPELKEVGYMTPATGEHLLEYSFDQLRPQEAHRPPHRQRPRGPNLPRLGLLRQRLLRPRGRNLVRWIVR